MPHAPHNDGMEHAAQEPEQVRSGWQATISCKRKLQQPVCLAFRLPCQPSIRTQGLSCCAFADVI